MNEDQWFVAESDLNVIVTCRRGNVSYAYALSKAMLYDLEEIAVDFVIGRILDEMDRAFRRG